MKKKLISYILILAMFICSVFTGVAFEAQTAYAYAVLPNNIGMSILDNGAKYLGYSYSQLYNRHGLDLTQTFDCSGLVARTMNESGFTIDTIPDSTLEWRAGFMNLNVNSTQFVFPHSNGTTYANRTLMYQGNIVQIKVVTTAESYKAAMIDPANAGKMVVLNTPASYQKLVDLDALTPGTLVIYPKGQVDDKEMPAHIATVAANIKPDMSRYIKCGVDYPSAYGQDIGYVYNFIKYQSEVYNNPEIQHVMQIAKKTTGVKPQFNLPEGYKVAEQEYNFKALFDQNKYSWPTIESYMGYKELLWNHYAMYRQPVFQVINKAEVYDRDKDFAAKGYYGIRSGVWFLEALNPTIGVVLSNRAETNEIGRSVYVVGFPSFYTTSATVNNVDEKTGEVINGSVYALTEDKELAGLISQAYYYSANSAISEMKRTGAYYMTTGSRKTFAKNGQDYQIWSYSGEHIMYMVQAYVPDGYEKDTNVYRVVLKDNGDASFSGLHAAVATTGSITPTEKNGGRAYILGNNKTEAFAPTVKLQKSQIYGALSLQQINSDYKEYVSGSKEYADTSIYAIFKGDLVNENWYEKYDEVKNLQNAIALAEQETKMGDAKAAFEGKLLYLLKSHLVGYIDTQKDGVTNRKNSSLMIPFDRDESGIVTIVQIYSGKSGRYELDTNIYTMVIDAHENTSDELTDALNASTSDKLKTSYGEKRRFSTVGNNTKKPLTVTVAGRERQTESVINPALEAGVYAVINGDPAKLPEEGGWSKYAVANYEKMQKLSMSAATADEAMEIFAGDGIMTSNKDHLLGYLSAGEKMTVSLTYTQARDIHYMQIWNAVED